MADGETAAAEYTIGWEPQPGPQTALLACPVFEVFFGGARGGGKTDGMLGEWASHADFHGKNAVGLMVRRERVQLLETIERSRQSMCRSGRDTTIRTRCGAGRTELDFALLISSATRTPTLTRGTATRGCMSRSWARSRASRRF
jgi:hypothetical protein